MAAHFDSRAFKSCASAVLVQNPVEVTAATHNLPKPVLLRADSTTLDPPNLTGEPLPRAARHVFAVAAIGCRLGSGDRVLPYGFLDPVHRAFRQRCDRRGCRYATGDLPFAERIARAEACDFIDAFAGPSAQREYTGADNQQRRDC